MRSSIIVHDPTTQIFEENMKLSMSLLTSLVEKICLLIEDTELRNQMGKAGVLSSKKYDAEKIMPHWNSLLESFFIKE